MKIIWTNYRVLIEKDKINQVIKKSGLINTCISKCFYNDFGIETNEELDFSIVTGQGSICSKIFLDHLDGVKRYGITK